MIDVIWLQYMVMGLKDFSEDNIQDLCYVLNDFDVWVMDGLILLHIMKLK